MRRMPELSPFFWCRKSSQGHDSHFKILVFLRNVHCVKMVNKVLLFFCSCVVHEGALCILFPLNIA